MTKKQFCMSLIQDHLDAYNLINLSDITEDMIVNNKHLAVAMEYLGILSPQMLKYSKEYTGVLFVYENDEGNIKHFSVRDLIPLLPE